VPSGDVIGSFLKMVTMPAFDDSRLLNFPVLVLRLGFEALNSNVGPAGQ
jgi:hypothetical protein